MITPRGAARIVHALLDDHPMAVVGDDEAVQIEVETILDGGAVDLGHEPAGIGERGAVDPDPLADRRQFVWRLARLLAAAAADMDSEFARQRLEAALQRADHARGDARGVPVHAHDRAERLKPERVSKAAQQLVAAVMVDDRLAMTAPSRVMRSASHGGTRPPCSGRSALPDRWAMRGLETGSQRR